MRIYLITKIADDYKKNYKVKQTGSKIICYLIKKKLLKQGYITKITCVKYPNILQYETYYYPN